MRAGVSHSSSLSPLWPGDQRHRAWVWDWESFQRGTLRVEHDLECLRALGGEVLQGLGRMKLGQYGAAALLRCMNQHPFGVGQAPVPAGSGLNFTSVRRVWSRVISETKLMQAFCRATSIRSPRSNGRPR